MGVHESNKAKQYKKHDAFIPELHQGDLAALASGSW